MGDSRQACIATSQKTCSATALRSRTLSWNSGVKGQDSESCLQV